MPVRPESHLEQLPSLDQVPCRWSSPRTIANDAATTWQVTKALSGFVMLAHSPSGRNGAEEGI